MTAIAGSRAGRAWILRILGWWRAACRRPRRLPGIDGLNDHMRRDVGLDR